MRSRIALLLTALILLSCSEEKISLKDSPHNLVSDSLAVSWDEAIPLGNGMSGVLVWKKNNKLRLSVDRADLWDLRPMPNLDSSNWRYSWVFEQWKNNNYKAVQDAFDRPYDELPAPSKIPAGAIEFDISGLGETESVKLDINQALCEVKWKKGARLLAFVSAAGKEGWFSFEGAGPGIIPVMIPPAYNVKGDGQVKEMSFFDLERLGYKQGEVKTGENSFVYNQEGWGGFKYSVACRWRSNGKKTEGCWTISSELPGKGKTESAELVAENAISEGFSKAFTEHSAWWKDFWSRSAIEIPDTVLEKQWYLEMYKFGSTARPDAPPVSLQAVWTADNGKLPPWKGDFHNDLNTQLSYWPAYSSNHIDLEEGFINWLWKNRDTFKKYTMGYFGVEGLNVPGVATLTGEPMGGWIQYSFGPTVGAWLSHHFYLHWRYTQDRDFLEERAYPWLTEVSLFLNNISVKGEDEKQKLPISSSPEIFNNSAQAWFPNTSNYDLALKKWNFEKTAELAEELGLDEEAMKWRRIASGWPGFATDDKTGFMFAPGIKYDESHRHFSHQMAYHPLGLVDYSGGDDQQSIIDKTLKRLEEIGPDWWCGYSYSWLGGLYARAFKGDKAAEALRTFSTAFCLPNSFHVNGDQTRSGKSKFTYRPFTLEGNFAFASALQEMLLQSHSGVVRIFPAIPGSWKDARFSGFRTEGAMIVSANLKDSKLETVTINSEKGGRVKLFNSFPGQILTDVPYTKDGDLLIIETTPGQTFSIKAVARQQDQ